MTKIFPGSSVGSRYLSIVVLGVLLVGGPAHAIGRVVAFGDSITDGRGDEEGLGGYPPRLQKHLRDNGHPDAVVVASGVRGETTPEGLSRIGSAIGSAEIVVILEGANDIFQGISVETSAKNVLKMASLVRSKNAKPVISTLTPFWFRASVNRGNALTIEHSNVLREGAFAAGDDLADVFDAYWRTPDRNFDLYDDRFVDRLGHPNAAGHSLIAQVIGDQLADIDSAPPVVGTTIPRDGASKVVPGKKLNIKLYDFGTGVDAAESTILVNGEPVQTFRSDKKTRVELGHTPATPWTGVIKVEVITQDLASPANSIERFATLFSIDGTSFFRGDINFDGRVDGHDLAQLSFSFGTTSADTDYRLEADINSDGSVDGEDLAILANNFGQISG